MFNLLKKEPKIVLGYLDYCHITFVSHIIIMVKWLSPFSSMLLLSGIDIVL